MIFSTDSGKAPDGLLLIGWKEYLDFPEWGISRVKAKIDTGARTSALDVARCELVSGANGLVARLTLALNRHRPQQLVQIEAPVLRQTKVASSDGVREERPVIEALVRVGTIEKRIQLSVTDRSGMLFPILLGREALAGSFVVDVNRKYLMGKRRRSRDLES
jgi:hypothetical protein